MFEEEFFGYLIIGGKSFSVGCVGSQRCISYFHEMTFCYATLFHVAKMNFKIYHLFSGRENPF